eukprot:5701018-Alexandrium_andersonii.AAC.1
MCSLQHCLRVPDRPQCPQVLQSELRVGGGPHDLAGDHRSLYCPLHPVPSPDLLLQPNLTVANPILEPVQAKGEALAATLGSGLHAPREESLGDLWR